jgi:hypothetical protein
LAQELQTFDRMKITLLFLLALAISFVAQIQSGGAQVYKWKDDKGVVHFTDDPGRIPEKYQGKAQTGPVESPPAPPPQAPSSPQSVPPRTAPTPAAKAGDGYRDSAGRDESYWKDRVDQWKKNLASAQEKEQALRLRYNELTERANSTKNQGEKYQLRQERDQVKVEIDQQRIKIEEAKKMLEKTIPEEAGLFKAKPEWVR